MRLNSALLILVSTVSALDQIPFINTPALQTISQPPIGFGTWNLKISEDNTTDAVAYAIEAGYRQIDCAAIYGNEVAVGKGIKEGLERTGLNREEIWVTSKLWNDHHGDKEIVEAALDKTLKDLDLEYLDLYLMHWPVQSVPDSKKQQLSYVETWESLVALPKSKVLNVGVSNFSPSQLHTLISETGVKPFAHQMELHPYLPQSAWVAEHKELGISLTGYSPLGNMNPIYSPKGRAPPKLLENDVVQSIAAARGCTPAQVVLKWGLGRGVSVIPKSSHKEHIKENLESLKCELTHSDLTSLRIVGRKWLTRFNNPSGSWGVDLFDGLQGLSA